MSGKVTEQTIEEIRARVDIVELIGARMTLKKSGATFKGCCPFHHEKTPSFHVNPVRQTYHCFGCGEHGDVFKFLEKQDGLTFIDAVRNLAERVGVVLQESTDYHAQSRNLLYAIHAELAAFYQRCLKQTQEAAPARDYLAGRKLPDDVVERFGIGYAPTRPRDALLQWAKKYGHTPEQLVSAGILTPPKSPDRPDDYFDRFRGRLMFPICDRQGRVVAFSARILDAKSHPAKYVNSPETDIFTKSRILYALDKAAAKIVKHPRREAIICEGQIDVIRCHACGFETAVASQGTAFTKDHVAILKKHADSVVLVFDGDSAGRKAALRTGALFLEEEIPVRVASLPKGEDPDSMLRDKGAAPFRELLDRAASITAFQVDTLRQAEEHPDSIDAVNRVARGVIEMLAGCPNAVQRSHLLEEASRLLHLPLTAFEEDLERHRADQSRKAAYAAAYKERDRAPAAARPELAAEDEAPPPTDDLVPEDADGSGPLPEEPPPEPPSRTEFLLCEFLVEHEHDAEVLDLMERYLPLDILVHPFTRSVADAILKRRHEDGDRLAALARATEPHWQPLLGALIANQQKMLSAREATPLDAAQDLIRRAWLLCLKRQRGQLEAASTTENDTKRFQLSMLLKTMETQPWEKASRLMLAAAGTLTPEAHRERPQASAAATGEAEPSGRAADTACGADGPEEFPPSEYPPDERLD